MIYFQNDYTMGAHPEIIKALIDTNNIPLEGYGLDLYTRQAAEKIKEACHSPKSDVYFLTGGTQANKIIIDSYLEDYEGVISATTGHIYDHEAGAVEATGRKILPIPSEDGKITAQQIQSFLDNFYADPSHSHKIYPGMIYITHPTELGTMYTKEELTAISKVANENHLPLFMDGARLIYALMSEHNDLELEDLANLCDIFYIGGTKAGLLCGEALVFKENTIPKHFLTRVKRHGALNAKGRLIGVQFDRLFTDQLYQEIGKTGIKYAIKLKEVLHNNQIEYFLETPTNQQFVILNNKQYDKLSKEICMTYWQAYDENNTVVRFVTSWSTTNDDIQQLNKLLKNI